MRSSFSLCCAIACISGFALPLTAPGQPVSNLGTYQVNSIGHTFFPGAPPGGGPVPRSIDYLIDQSQSSGGGGTVGVLANLNANSQFSLTITAPPGERFFIDVPTLQPVHLTGSLKWSNGHELGGPGGSSLPMTFVLVGSGIDPIPSTFNLSQYVSGFQFIFGITLSADTSFTAIQFNGTVPGGIGSEMYFPSLNDQVVVDYFPPSNADPGPVAFIVPEPGVNSLLFLGFLLVLAWRIKQNFGGSSSARDFSRGQR